MIGLSLFNDTFSYSSERIDLKVVFKDQKWFEFYFESTKYFFLRGRLFCLTERQLGVIIYLVSFLLGIAIRKLLKRLKIRKRILKLIKKLWARGTVLPWYVFLVIY